MHTPHTQGLRTMCVFLNAVWRHRLYMVCSFRYGMPHEPPPNLSHQSSMREQASSHAVCRSFILALLGMVIGSQSTSNRWIGSRPGWLSGAAVYARVYSCVCVVVRGCACSPSMHAALSLNNSTSVSLHLLFLIWIFSFFFSSSLNHRQCCCSSVPGSWAAEQDGIFCEQVFLTSPSNYYQDTAKCNPSGNEHSSWQCNPSVVLDEGERTRCEIEGKLCFTFMKQRVI